MVGMGSCESRTAGWIGTGSPGRVPSSLVHRPPPCSGRSTHQSEQNSRTLSPQSSPSPRQGRRVPSLREPTPQLCGAATAWPGSSWQVRVHEEARP